MCNIKGVIVAAGYGSRFLPATKTVPKEMLPLLDRPAIDFIVEEFLAAGIRQILIITSRRKKALEDYFDREVELESVFLAEAKQEKLQQVQPPDCEVFFVRQQAMHGTGHALLTARAFLGDSPFVVAYPDDLFPGAQLTRELVDLYRRTGKSVLAVQDLKDADVSRYGVVDPRLVNGELQVARLVEKPPRGQEPSHLVSYGRYLFDAQIWDPLQRGWDQHEGGEYYHIGALNEIAAQGRLLAHIYQGLRLDTGEPLGFLEAVCRYALSRPEWRDAARNLFAGLAAAPEDQDC